jgi:hypothetical protein
VLPFADSALDMKHIGQEAIFDLILYVDGIIIIYMYLPFSLGSVMVISIAR